MRRRDRIDRLSDGQIIAAIWLGFAVVLSLTAAVLYIETYMP
jgi:hypothetical protein